ncbi:putative maintenance of ploidy protein mob1 [Zalerion maritima]|uniref:Maintenance of ploidy protein mob1 n=1 Tax=Zalerion maritima TaxID=339359 RepID=A0AAD5WQG6_9PEZI|nr:putative maintenance of ploidy protein mob1 [Zalerion maritima]
MSLVPIYPLTVDTGIFKTTKTLAHHDLLHHDSVPSKKVASKLGFGGAHGTGSSRPSISKFNPRYRAADPYKDCDASTVVISPSVQYPAAVLGKSGSHHKRYGNNRNQRTRNQFRPRPGKGATSYQLRQYAEATLGGGSLRKVVKLPEGEDENEWLAVNMVDFYNQINLLYGAITEFCSPQSCPEMKATDEFEYLWQDSENYKRPTKMPAPAYIEQLMSWVQGNIDNESVLPSRIGVPFPKTFPALVRQIFKRMYRVYAHIYCHHYPVIRELGLEPHLNTSFKQYVLFIDEHNLATGKDFWGPLGDLVDSMLKSD